jgi:starch synthase
MGTDAQNETVLRFDVVVHGASYRALVEGLRSPHLAGKSRTSPRKPVKAAIELDLQSKQYSLSTIGRHRLPKGLRVQPGSRTHSNLTGYLASHLTGDTARTISHLLSSIIESTPVIHTDALKLFREDIQIQDPTRPSTASLLSQKVFVVDDISTEISLDIDDIPTPILPEVERSHLEDAVQHLESSIELLAPVTASVVGNLVEISAALLLPVELSAQTEIFLHWGSYEESSPPWQDELVVLRSDLSGSRHTLLHRLHIPTRGNYGLTLFAQIRGTTKPVWLGRSWVDDARVSIVADDLKVAQERAQAFEKIQGVALRELSRCISLQHDPSQRCEMIAADAPHLGLGALLAQASESQESRQHLAALAQSLDQGSSPSALLSALLNYGIGEIVFATPEGPHAAAGGLAQVISGLPPELCRAGIPVTVIAPLYCKENGNRHTSAQQLLRHGVKLGGEKIRPTLLGTISVPLGPTYHSGTTCVRRQPATIPLKVYLAQRGALRLFLLSNSSVFDRLYQPVFSDEQLRRSVILSRGALELIALPQFGIRPSAIVSNDWMTACIPPILSLDTRYQTTPWLRSCKTMHMIHNGGADYHGRLPANLNNEDLWPLLGLAPEHFLGFQDPHNGDLLNLTMAATRHVSGAVLTVSQTYATELATPGCGDGLEWNLLDKRERVFGISNGINRPEVERFLCALTGQPSRSFTTLEELLAGKRAIQTEIQRRFGLNAREDARIISFVGRLAEQKGLSLLSGLVSNGTHSVLEEILITNPDVQILLAGPMTDGDREARNLSECLAYLTPRYPGRICAHLDYVPHAQALEIIFGSTFFLMPSRFEPGGITQLEALAAGTLVVGRRVGGIAATIDNYCQEDGTGSGFLCNDYTPGAFAATVQWALGSTRDRNAYGTLVRNAVEARHDWSSRVPLYRALFQQTLLGREACASMPWLQENMGHIRLCAIS